MVGRDDAYMSRFWAPMAGLNQSPQGECIKPSQIVQLASVCLWAQLNRDVNSKHKCKTTWILTGDFNAHCSNLVQCSQETVPAIGVKTLAILLTEDLHNKACPNIGHIHNTSLQ
jgi:hypothetical protein